MTKTKFSSVFLNYNIQEYKQGEIQRNSTFY